MLSSPPSRAAFRAASPETAKGCFWSRWSKAYHTRALLTVAEGSARLDESRGKYVGVLAPSTVQPVWLEEKVVARLQSSGMCPVSYRVRLWYAITSFLVGVSATIAFGLALHNEDAALWAGIYSFVSATVALLHYAHYQKRKSLSGENAVKIPGCVLTNTA